MGNLSQQQGGTGGSELGQLKPVFQRHRALALTEKLGIIQHYPGVQL